MSHQHLSSGIYQSQCPNVGTPSTAIDAEPPSQEGRSYRLPAMQLQVTEEMQAAPRAFLFRWYKPIGQWGLEKSTGEW